MWRIRNISLVALVLLAVVPLWARATAPDALTPAERAWLQQHGPLRYAPDPAFAPFEFFDAEGRAAGVTPELLSVLASNLGTRIDVVRYPTWSAVLEGIQRGDVDLLGTVTRTPERDAFLSFTKPYLDVPYVLFVGRDVPADATLADFVSARVGVVRNYGADAWLRGTHPEIDPVPVETTKEGLLLLSLGRLDAMLETLPVGAQVILDNSLNNVRFLPDVLFTTPQHLAVSRGNATLQAILQKGLASIPAPTRSAVIARWLAYDQLKPRGRFPEWAGRAMLGLAIALAVLLAWNIALRRMVARQTRELSASESRQRTLLQNLPQRVFLKDTRSAYVYCNQAYARDVGVTPEQVTGKTDHDFFPRELADKYRADDQRVIATRMPLEADEEYIQGGRRRIIHTTKTPLCNAQGDVTGVLGVFWDITESRREEELRRELEVQLRQAQKMEAVGRLAGGLAHDFNNILTVILGNANLMAVNERLSQEARENATDIADAADRASGLIRQLLAFSRRQIVKMQAVNLNEVLERMQRILSPLLGSHIELVCDLDPSLPPVSADPGMLEQVILNLAINARDAMAQGGILTLRTATQTIDGASTISESSRPPGRYAVLSVADTGVGMDDVIQQHLFEPFFTTKDTGQGTGLGLATVYGIVQQHRGWIEVASAPGRGSCFSVFLPVSFDDVARADSAVSETAAAQRGTEVILVAEDEAALRKMTSAALQRLGYRVLEAANGPDALVLWESVGTEVQLLLTDIVMPGGLSGLDLARRLRAQRPGLKVLFSSGYSDDVMFRQADLPPDSVFLAKPYDVGQLAAAVRRCLDT